MKKYFKIDLFLKWKFFEWRLSNLLFNTEDQVNDRQETDLVRFELSAEKLSTLLLNRQVCAADIRCLDAQSKQCLKMLCLKTCLSNTHLP